MSRLQSELNRLYLASDPTGPQRAVVLELARPADWAALSAVWRGVQTELGLPAPAIAVSGLDAYQLWFSFATPLPSAQAIAFAELLRARYLADIAKARTGIFTASSSAVFPPRQVDLEQDHWSAFVAPDLAPVFGDQPWLDVPPSAEGQADLLCRLESIKTPELQALMLRLGSAPQPQLAPAPEPAEQIASVAKLDPSSFLLKVMNDESVELPLRMEAAKILLQAKK